jgi:hypothetical protein
MHEPLFNCRLGEPIGRLRYRIDGRRIAAVIADAMTLGLTALF